MKGGFIVKAEVWNILNELNFCAESLKQIAEEAEHYYDRGTIDKKEFYARVRWYWYQTVARIMDESFDKNMPMPQWREGE